MVCRKLCLSYMLIVALNIFPSSFSSPFQYIRIKNYNLLHNILFFSDMIPFSFLLFFPSSLMNCIDIFSVPFSHFFYIPTMCVCYTFVVVIHLLDMVSFKKSFDLCFSNLKNSIVICLAQDFSNLLM